MLQLIICNVEVFDNVIKEGYYNVIMLIMGDFSIRAFPFIMIIKETIILIFSSRGRYCLFMATISFACHISDSTGHVFGDRVMRNAVPVPESTDGSLIPSK